MAIDTEQKRWSMLGVASGVGRNFVFNPDTSGLSSIEKITVLRFYGGISWGSPPAPILPVRDLSYTPGPVPYNVDELVRYLTYELYRISTILGVVTQGYVQEVHVEPVKPRTGDKILTDGVDWDPGSGAGVYCYYNGVWNKL